MTSSKQTFMVSVESCTRLLAVQVSYLKAMSDENITLDGYECRLAAVEPLLDKFESNFCQVYALMSPEEQKTYEPRYSKFTTEYFQVVTTFKDRIRARKSLQAAEQVTNTTTVTNSTSSVKTPRLEIHPFDGSTSSWLRFRDIFEATIHKKDNISNIEKLSYLISSVKLPSGETNVLDNFTVCGDNYEAAWKSLCERYNNKGKLISMLCNTLFGLEKMKSESKQEIQKLIDSFTSPLSSLKQLGYALSEMDDFANMMVVQLALSKLEPKTMREWKKHNKEDCATWKQLLEFLATMGRSLDDDTATTVPVVKTVENKIHSDNKTQHQKNNRSSFVSQPGKSRELKCVLCFEPHLLWSCPKFIAMSISDRQKTVKDKRLCWNCFSAAHQVKACGSKHRCKTCDKTHHTLLHQERGHPTTNLSPNSKPFEPFNMQRTTSNGGESSRNSNVVSHSSESFNCARRQTFLSTVLIEVEDSEGNFHPARALLDSGSDDNFMTTQLARKLNLNCTDVCVPLTGIGERTSIVHHQTSARISSCYGAYVRTLNFSVMASITGNIPSQSVSTAKWNIPTSHFLADPDFNRSAKIDMLLSVDVFYDVLLNETVELQDGPKMIHTRFGWILGGSINCASQSSPQALLSCYKDSRKGEDPEFTTIVDRYFAADEVDVEIKPWTAEEQYCEDDFKATAFLGADGHWWVHMPVNNKITKLGKNLKNAFMMLYAQEAQRSKNATVNVLYIGSMNDFQDCDHMEEVDPRFAVILHYLPHHGVVKMSSTSTKVRPVCNASSISETGISLNDALCVGPVVQPESFDILLRFREKPFVIMGDLTKMYRQIWVYPEQRAYLTILWRENPEIDSVKHFQLKTVTFGTACASFLATRVVLEIANLNETRFPHAAKVIKNSIYVDDMLAGFTTLQEAKKVLNELRYIFSSNGMTLCKLSANNPEILADVPRNQIEGSPDIQENNIVKALGIRCELVDDQLTFAIAFPPCKTVVTKTVVLSENASIYDPIGFLGPVVLKGKLFIKKLWTNKRGWKEPLSQEEQDEWAEFRSQLHLLSDIKIKRQCIISNSTTVELHGFSDASIEAYGCCIYLRSINSNCEVQVSLICAKSKVAPMKQQSLARLELCGALLLAKLVNRVLKILETPINEINCWSDSTIVLNWIGMQSTQLQTFVGNRVAEIQRLTAKATWRHAQGIHNPADEISRGRTPQELLDSKLWWNGPEFLIKPKCEWPETILTVSENCSEDPEIKKEVKKCFVINTANSLFEYIELRYSNTRTLFNVIAYFQRYKHNSRPNSVRRDGPLAIEEVVAAEMTVYKTIQQTVFNSEYDVLQQQSEIRTRIAAGEVIADADIPQISRKSSLISLSPFLDNSGVMRVGGRLQNSLTLGEDAKHPIILPQCNFTTLVIRETHQRNLHPGHSATLAFIRQKFWPLRAKSTIRKVIHNCIVCFRMKPVDSHQLMAPLPPARVNSFPLFYNTALDYAGFFSIRTGNAPRSPVGKCYVAVFKCMATGLIHLDIASDLTTQAFLATFDRFVSRRGLCKQLYSDNATCFEGADNELKDIVERNHGEVADYIRERKIQWKFTTPRASHAGGIYESAVKNMKHHLKRVMIEQQHTYTFEQWQTLLVKIEAVLNSRPLTPMTENPDDIEVLTPAHFLIGRPLIAKAERNYLNVNTNRLDMYQKLQQAQQKFWHFWYHDFLHNLQQRPINFREQHTFRVGDLVLLKDSNLPTMKWLLGRIVQLFPGKDKVVRNVKVKTEHGFKERHVKYLCLLPMEVTPVPAPECVPDSHIE